MADESVNFKLKGDEEMMNVVLSTPLNSKLDDSGYYTFSETRNRFALSPSSLNYLTPDVTAIPPPFVKDDFAASPVSRPELFLPVPRFQLPSHEDKDHELAVTNIRKGPQKLFTSNTGIPPKKHTLGLALTPVSGQEIGESHIDFFKELLHSYNCPMVVKKILSYLTARDLRSISCVSKIWRQTCMSDSMSNAARLKEVQRLKKKFTLVEKENTAHVKDRVTFPNASNYQRGLFGNITNVAGVEKKSYNMQQQNESVPLVNARFQLFQEEAKKLLPCERLQPCPRCTLPSRVDPYKNRGLCSRTFCAYDFCTKCRCQYHDSLPCYPVLSKPKQHRQKDLAGTKASRRSLKRL